jgi:RNA polymerase-binding transcription factor DksA
MKPIQKTPAEKAQQINAQRHIQESKPLMEVSVVRYKDADLAMFKEVILKKIAKAKEEIDFYSDQIKNSSESETQFASIDDGSMTSERENMNQIVVRMQKLISHLESALVRIENKSYGICRETGKLIPKERLLVVPHATLSVEGKKMEKK